LEVRYWGDKLPSARGITLLPSDVLEEPCELVLCAAGSTKHLIASKQVRLPPSWTVLPWKTGPGSHWVFCIQVEDIRPSDVFDAKCHVMVMKPRLVLTNSSQDDIEVRFSETRIMRLAPGQSKEYHWQAKNRDEDQPAASLRFRPVREKAHCQWSGVVVCCDESAGSTPFALPKLPDDKDASAMSNLTTENLHKLEKLANSRDADSSSVRSGGTGTTRGSDSSQIAGQRRALDVEVWSVEVAPVRGAMSVTFREGSDFVAVNNCKRAAVRMSVRPHGFEENVASMVVPLGKEVEYGFTRPFSRSQRRSIELHINQHRIQIDDVRRTMRRISRSLQLLVSVSRDTRGKTVLTVQDVDIASLEAQRQRGVAQPRASISAEPTGSASASGTPATGTPASSPILLQFDIRVSKIGISLVEETIPRELLFLQLELIRFTFQRQENDIRSFRLIVSEAQVDCQLPGRVDRRTCDRRRNESLALLNRERPAVILANCAYGDRAFLTFFLQRGATSSRDILLPKVDIDLDALDITIDDMWLDPLVQWLEQTRPERGAERGTPFREILETAGRSSLEGYVAPELPFVVQVDHMSIGSVNLTVWALLKLKSVNFLPQYVRTAIRVLSASGQFTLDGASLFLPNRQFPPHRGSLRDFFKGLGNEYIMNLINNVANMLGKSSVLNLPRAPLKVGSTVVSYITDSVGLFAGESSSIMSQLTFDDEYIAKQRAVRDGKQIKGFHDGVVEAGKSLAQGIEGVADLWKKPQEGHRQNGMDGFWSGLGMGLVGSLVKPVEKLGQAISDVGTGIAAQVTPDTACMKRRRARLRQRRPRLLFSQLGAIRPWSTLAAEVLEQLGPERCTGVEEVLSLSTDDHAARAVLLLFPQHFLIVQIVREVRNVLDAPEPPAREGRRGNVETAATSSNSTAIVVAQPAQPIDFFEAFDESALKILTQAAKPLNTLVYGVQDMEAQRAGESREQILRDAELWKRAREFHFRDLKAVHTRGENEDLLLQLEDQKGGIHSLPLFSAPFGHDVKRALVAGFRSSLTNSNRIANWEPLRLALQAECTTKRRANALELMAARRQSGGVGERVLEVFEVERKHVAEGEWKTPFLPIDVELGHRWVDATCTRHPHLFKNLTVEQYAKSKTPPCEIGSLFVPTSDWSVHKGKDTDKDGWKYGLAWNSSTWDTTPGLFDGIRKRRWTRRFE